MPEENLQMAGDGLAYRNDGRDAELIVKFAGFLPV